MAEVGNNSSAMKGSGVQLRLGSVVEQIALLPASLRGWFRWMLYDLLSYHRLGVLKRHRMPGGRRSQQMLATRLWRYTKFGNNPDAIAQVMGEGFAAAQKGSDEGAGYVNNPRFFDLIERGGQVTAGALMAVPIMAGRQFMQGGLHTTEEFKKALKADGIELDIVPRPGKPPLLVEHMRGKSNRYRARDRIFAVLTKQTSYRPMLGYYAEWEKAQAKFLPVFEKALERAMTTAGRASLEKGDTIVRAGREAYLARYKEMIAAGHRGRAARNAAAIAEKEAKRAAIASAGERA